MVWVGRGLMKATLQEGTVRSSKSAQHPGPHTPWSLRHGLPLRGHLTRRQCCTTVAAPPHPGARPPPPFGHLYLPRRLCYPLCFAIIKAGHSAPLDPSKGALPRVRTFPMVPSPVCVNTHPSPKVIICNAASRWFKHLHSALPSHSKGEGSPCLAPHALVPACTISPAYELFYPL